MTWIGDGGGEGAGGGFKPLALFDQDFKQLFRKTSVVSHVAKGMILVIYQFFLTVIKGTR